MHKIKTAAKISLYQVCNMAPKKPPEPSEHKRVSDCITSVVLATLAETTPSLHELARSDRDAAQRVKDFITQRLKNREGRTIAAEASYLIENSLSIARECLYDSAKDAVKRIRSHGGDVSRLEKEMRLVDGKRVMRFKSLDEIRRIQAKHSKDTDTVEGLQESDEESSEEKEDDEDGDDDESDEEEEERDDDDETVAPGDSSSQVGEYGCRKRKHGK